MKCDYGCVIVLVFSINEFLLYFKFFVLFGRILKLNFFLFVGKFVFCFL